MRLYNNTNNGIINIFFNYQIYLKVCLKTRFVINKDDTNKVIENKNKINLISKINK